MCKSRGGISENFFIWNKCHSDMIRPRPVESGALDNKKMLLPQQIQHHFPVILDVEFFYINFREHVKCRFWFDSSDPRDLGEKVVNNVSLFAKLSAWHDKLVN